MRINRIKMISKPEGLGLPVYFQKYIDPLVENDLLIALDAGLDRSTELIRALSTAQLRFTYAPGKWSLAQVLIHIMDTERVFSYRAMAFARGDQTALPGFDENAYASNDGSHLRDVSDLLDEYQSIRSATLALFSNMFVSALDNLGNANGVVVSPRSLGWMIAGHEAHHFRVIRERYL